MTFKRSNLERQIFDMPKEVKRCKRCVISNQRPRIIFNEEGLCSACLHNDYKYNEVDWVSFNKMNGAFVENIAYSSKLIQQYFLKLV